MNNSFIVMSAPNGARKTKADHPSLPVSANELADCAESVLAEGASIIHVHVRDDEGRHSLDTERYRAAIASIRDRVGDRLIIQTTTEACGLYTPEQQMLLVRDLKPEAVSLALGELCADESRVSAAADFFQWLSAENIMPQYILYSPEEVNRFECLRSRGVIPSESPFVLFVLGRYAENLTGDVSTLRDFVAESSDDTSWAVCCFGGTEYQAVSAAASADGHARVGFENNLLMPDGSVAADNAALIRGAVSAGRAMKRMPASAEDVRDRFS